MRDFRKQIGKKGEKLAVKFLKKKGFKIVKTNFQTRFGEIDIIARKGRCLHFVEVRSTSTDYLNSPGFSINFAKRKQIKKVASYYFERFALKNKKIEESVFSVVLVKFKEDDEFEIEFIEDAFS